MYRIASSRLIAPKGHPGNLAAVRYATSAVAVRPSSPGFFSWLTGEHSSSLPPLDTPLKGVPHPHVLPDFIAPSGTKITTLKNGVKIASEHLWSPAASIGLYINSGSAYETSLSSGASHLLERMAFKSTANRSHLRIVREVEALGGCTSSSASREQMAYTVEAIKTYIPEMVELLVDCVRNPAFLEWEVNEELQKVKAELGELSKNPQLLLLEAVLSTGYAGAFGNPFLARESALDRLNSSILEEFIVENYTGHRMVLAASGVAHEELLEIAEPLLSDVPAGTYMEEPKSSYVGGDYCQQADLPGTHFALAFEVPGGWKNAKEAMTVTVLQMLMGGGGLFSAGGPGKGMHSWLYLRVLNKHEQIQSFSAFASVFNNTGLFGIFGSTSPDFVSKAVDIAVEELTLVAKHGAVSQLQLNRAKEATKSAFLMNLESRTIVAEDIGRQMLTYGERKPMQDFLDMVDEVTSQSIATTAEKIISSPLTMASYGDVINVPRYDSVNRRFHAN